MKKIYTLLAALLMTTALMAQHSDTWKINIVENQPTGSVVKSFYINEIVKFLFDKDSHIAQVVVDASYYDENYEYVSRLDTLEFSPELIDRIGFSTNDARWNLPYTEPVTSYGYGLGYPALMMARDRLSQEMNGKLDGMDWFAPWEEASYIGPNFTASTYMANCFMDMIAEANLMIRSIAPDNTDTNLKGALAVAYASRALIYLDFARMYEYLPVTWTNFPDGINEYFNNVNGLTVPIIDENTKTQGEYFDLYEVPRATKAEMVQFILSDLDKAEALMQYNINESKTLPHLDALYGLKARLYLWDGQYQLARQYARQAIEATTSKPMTQEQILSTTEGFNNLDCWMWGIQYEPGTFGNLHTWTAWMSNEAEYGYGSREPEKINPYLYRQIRDTDVRKRLWIAPENTPLYGQTPLINPDRAYEDYTTVKFRPKRGEIYDWAVGSATAVPLMRVEEMYLIEAEAAAHLNAEEGISLLTSFMTAYRDASYTYPSDIERTGTPLISEIILQKRIELWGEGQSFFDLKRLNLPVINYSYQVRHTDRPAYFNLIFPRSMENANLALKLWNNPNVAGFYESVDFPVDTLFKYLPQSFTLYEPAFTQDIKVLPLDSVYQIMLSREAPENPRGYYLNYNLELSVDSTFDPRMTYGLGNTTTVTAMTINDFLAQIHTLDGKPVDQEEKIFLRYVAYPDECSSYFITSNEVGFRVRPFDSKTRASSYGVGYSKAPQVSVEVVNSVVDMNYYAGQSYIPIVRVNVADGGSVRSNPYLRLDTQPWDPTEFNYYNNPYTSFISIMPQGAYYEYVQEDIFEYHFPENPGRFTFDYVQLGSFYTAKDNLIFQNGVTDLPAITFIPNSGYYNELPYAWLDHAFQIYQSQIQDPEKVILQHARNDENVWRLVNPYMEGYNLMFTSNAEGQVTVDRQVIYSIADKNGNVTPASVYYAQGRGTMTDDLLTLYLSISNDVAGSEPRSVVETYSLEKQWEYLLNEDGTPAVIRFYSDWWDETHSTNIMYYEQNGVRYCRTDNSMLPVDSSQATVGYGPWGTDINFEFTWRLSDNAIDIPAQYFGQNQGQGDNNPVPDSMAIYVYDYYSLYEALGYLEGTGITNADEFYEAYPNRGRSYYDESNHSFFFNTKYWILGYGGWANYTNELCGHWMGYPDYYSLLTMSNQWESIEQLRKEMGFEVKLGTDCSYGLLTVFDGYLSDYEIINRFNHEELPGQVYLTQSGHYAYNMEGKPTGDYTGVLFTYDEAGEMVYYSFRYFTTDVGEGEPWNDQGKGDYTYTIVLRGTDSSLTVARQDKYYRVRDWFAGRGDLVFQYDSSLPEGQQVVIPHQSTGYYHKTYGEIFVCGNQKDSLYSYLTTDMSTGLPVFHLLLNYYVAAGSFGVNYETLTITDWQPLAQSDSTGYTAHPGDSVMGAPRLIKAQAAKAPAAPGKPQTEVKELLELAPATLLPLEKAQPLAPRKRMPALSKEIE